MGVSRVKQVLTFALVLAFCPGAACLGELPAQPGGSWAGTCSIGRTSPFTLDGMMWVMEGEDILVDATGLWALYVGSGTWEGIAGDAQLAVCVDEAFCRLNGVPFRPNWLVGVIDTRAQPFLQGRFEPDLNLLRGDCYVGEGAGSFTAER